MFKKALVGLAVFAFVVTMSSAVFAQGLTAQSCKDHAIAAAKLLEAEGDAAIAKIKDDKGEFRWADGQGYVWIHNLEGKMIMHPIKTALDGTDVSGTTDPKGFYLFVAMNELVKEKGQGWVAYEWPKPGQKDAAAKVSYVVLVKKDGKDYVAGAGLYDLTAADVTKQFPGDNIYKE